MTLQEQVKDALDEGRILLLGSQILIGFQWHAFFEKGYGKLSWFSQNLGLLALLAALVLFSILIAPVCYHSIVSQGEDTTELHHFATRTTESALIPFSATLAIDMYLSSSTLVSREFAVAIGVAGLLIALFFWFGLEILYLAKSTQPKHTPDKSGPTPLSVKIDHALTEARMVLPGVQALLGFQFILFFSESFHDLPESSKLLHLACLLLVCFCAVLLMTPAAFHRIVEQGEDTERFYGVANRLILTAMVPLALACSMEFYIVAAKITHSDAFACTVSGSLFLYFLILWFGYPYYLRKRAR